ncbi:MAG TPA: hypothetical protein VGI58_21660 [Streptosporangiaceae bacterium]
MRTWLAVARGHLVDRKDYTSVPWGVLAFAFLVSLIVFAAVPMSAGSDRSTGAVSSFYIFYFVLGILSMTRSLPFALMLGVSRRAYFAGTALLALTMAAVYGLGQAVLQVVERATGGWGVEMHMFRVNYLMPGPWYATWLTSAVLLIVLYLYGMWYGIVYRRWSVYGELAFIAAQLTAALIAVLAVTWSHGWPSVGRFFNTLTGIGLTGLLAALAVMLLAGGYATMRRVTV